MELSKIKRLITLEANHIFPEESELQELWFRDNDLSFVGISKGEPESLIMKGRFVEGIFGSNLDYIKEVVALEEIDYWILFLTNEGYYCFSIKL